MVKTKRQTRTDCAGHEGNPTIGQATHRSGRGQFNASSNRCDRFLSTPRLGRKHSFGRAIRGTQHTGRTGQGRYIGCSNFMAWQLCKALWKADVNGWVRMESVQPNYNLAVRDIESELLPFFAEEKIGTITYSPLGDGFLTGKYHTVGTAPKGTRFDIIPDHWDIYEGTTSMRRMEGLRVKAEETGRSMVNLALSWVIGQPDVTSVLVGARKLQHIDQAFKAEEMGLESELRQALNDHL